MHTIKSLFAGNQLLASEYSEGYLWETELDPDKEPKQVNIFLSDLENFIESNESNSTIEYYFGNYLLRKLSDFQYEIIDGQQRITTLVILLSALFSKLRKTDCYTDNQSKIFKCFILNNDYYSFETIEQDKLILEHYVIAQIAKNLKYPEVKTDSGKRIILAFDYFKERFLYKDQSYLIALLNAIQNASYTVKCVEKQSEYCQLFSFTNRFSN